VIYISLIASAVSGALIWALSPVITGAIEPWDAESPYYFVSLFIAGFLVGLFRPGNSWTVFTGIVTGQLIYMTVFLEAGPLMVLGVIFLLGYGLLSVLGALLASRLRGVAKNTDSGGENDI